MTIAGTHDIVQQVADLVEQHYVFADAAVGAAAAARSVPVEASSEKALAASMTRALQSINGDRHLRLLWHAEPVGDLADPDEVAAEHVRQAERTSYGVTSAGLSDRTALVTFRPLLFHPTVSGDAVTSTMRSVGDALRLVIDLRDCVGGAPSAVCLVLTYLLGPEVHLTDLVGRDPSDVRQLWTMPWVPGDPVAADVPVAVLTSSATFSGAEDLAYTLQVHGRAVVVGETTGGGAHPRRAFRVTDHLELTVPVTRAVNQVTGGNWEGVGVVPDVPCAAVDALDVALARLLEVRPG